MPGVEPRRGGLHAREEITRLETQVHAHKLDGIAGLGRIQIDPYDVIIGEQRQEPLPQIASNSRDDDAWLIFPQHFFARHFFPHHFFAHHMSHDSADYLGPGEAGLVAGPPAGGGKGIPWVGCISGPK